MLVAARDGLSGALVVRGEAGVGKTALLEHLVERASGCTVARAAGVQSEMELAFAGLHQLCTPFLDRLDRLPIPQQHALETAFGLCAGAPPDRFLIGLAVLTLLSEASDAQPLVCVVDDAQWLDRASAQALAFVARRLSAEAVVLVFGARDHEGEDPFAGVPELELDGLSATDARELLVAGVPGLLDERVLDQIVSETRGNPLALLELPRGSTIAELAGGFGLPGALPLSSRIEQSFRARVERLPEASRQLLLIAAAEPVGDPALLARACAQLGIGIAASAPAEADGLLELGSRISFRHPLVRSAVYRSAGPEARREAHRALAEATDPAADPDRRAWHRAHSVAGADETVAVELERSASRAQARGGLAAAAAFLARASELTPDPARRAERALEAARAEHLAGAPEPAMHLLATAQAGPLDELQQARADLVRAQIAFIVHRGGDAPQLLLAAARRLEPLAPALARETYLDAVSAAVFAAHLARGGGVREMALAARAAPPAPDEPRPHDLLLDGLAVLATEGHAVGTPLVERALAAFRRADLSHEEGLKWLWLACHTARGIWDAESWHALSTRHLALITDTGALALLPDVLSTRIGLHVYAGELATAAAMAEELRTVTQATASRLPPYGATIVAAWQGREAAVAALIDTAVRDASLRGEGAGLIVALGMDAVLNNGLGRYREALAAAEQARQHPDRIGSFHVVLPELIEAACRLGTPERAVDALDRLCETTGPSGTDWALGIEARSRALMTEGSAAEGLYLEAIDRLGRTRVRAELARAHLLYGEWLRRERRRGQAREELHAAHDMLSAMGIEAFAQRASRELVATGETARARVPVTARQLTAQEGQIARLARSGLSNPEIGAQLFISPRTVEYHLHKVFAKLGIGARGELATVLPSEERAPEPV